MATVIIGVGMTALMELLAAGTMTNAAATETTIAVNLARNIRELTMGLSFADPTDPGHSGLASGETIYNPNDLADLNGAVYSPHPIDAMGNPLTDMNGWTQEVAVRNVNPTTPGQVTGTDITGMRSITVTVKHNGNQVYQTSWLACQAMP